MIAKLLGYAVIVGASVVKIPQIVRLIKAGSARGIAASTYIIENIAYTICASYYMNNGYPFSTYGENIFLLLQGYVLVLLVFKFNCHLGPQFYLAAIAFTLFVMVLFTNVVGMQVLALLQGCSVPLTAASRVPQILTNFKNRSTGELSILTGALVFLGNTARVFTTFQEIDDLMALLPVMSSFVLNGTILLQIILYYGSDTKATKDKKSD